MSASNRAFTALPLGLALLLLFIALVIESSPWGWLAALCVCAMYAVLSERLKLANQRAADALAATRVAHSENSRLYQKTAQLEELKTQFFLGVSRELRTPLARMLGPTERMLKVSDPSSSAHHDLDIIARSTRTVLGHLDDLLEVSRLEAAKMTSECVVTDVGRLVRSIVRHFEPLARKKHITYALELPEALQAQIDPDKLRCVMLNLLANAFKFSPDAGRVRMSMRAAGVRVVIEVADSGPGIPPDERDRVFERFWRFEGVSAQRFSGSGLGLAIAREFVTAHGGVISVGDAPEGGALFRVSLPQSQASREEMDDSAGARRVLPELSRWPGVADTGIGAVVLVIEDDAEMNRCVDASLARDHRVETALEGTQGLRMALELRPDLIVTDVATTGMDGGELVRNLRSKHELDPVPIVVLAKNADDGPLAELLGDGAQDYVAKPFVREQLRARIDNLIAARRALAFENRLDVIEQAPDGIFIANAAGRCVEANAAGCRMLGYSRDEILDMQVSELIRPEDTEPLLQWPERGSGGEVQWCEWCMRRKDGTLLPAQVSTSLLPNGNGLAFIRDISERKKAQDALLRSEIRYRNLFQHMVNAYALVRVLLDSEGRPYDFRYEEVNLAFERILGLRAEHVIGKTMREVFPRLEPDWLERIGKVAITGQPIYVEQYSATYGRHYELSAFRPEPGLVVLIFADITVRKRDLLAEVGPVLSTKREEEALSIIAHIAVRDFADFCVVDLVDDAGEIRRVEAVSHDPAHHWACELFTQVPLDRTRPHLLHSSLTTKQSLLLEHVSSEMLEALAQNKEHLRQLRSANPSSIITVPMLAGSKLLGAMAFIASKPSPAYGAGDLQLAEELALRAALAIENARLHRAEQQAIRARDEVLGVVAHDLRNPVGAILVQVALLQRDSAATCKRAQLIDRSARRIKRLIEDLLDITRADAGVLSIERARISAAQLASDAIEEHRSLATDRSIELSLHLQRRLPELFADRDRLLQVLDNLISNALKFTEPGGRVELRADVRKGKLLFRVADNGAGIAAADLQHVFDRFWHKRESGNHGAGLGLAIAKSIVEAHAGEIWIESEVGRGTTAFVKLPLTVAKSRGKTATE